MLTLHAIATAAASYVYRVLYRKPISSHMSYVGLDAVRPVPIAPDTLQPYLSIHG